VIDRPCQRCENAQQEIQDLRHLLSDLRADLRDSRRVVQALPDPDSTTPAGCRGCFHLSREGGCSAPVSLATWEQYMRASAATECPGFLKPPLPLPLQDLPD